MAGEKVSERSVVTKVKLTAAEDGDSFEHPVGDHLGDALGGRGAVLGALLLHALGGHLVALLLLLDISLDLLQRRLGHLAGLGAHLAPLAVLEPRLLGLSRLLARAIGRRALHALAPLGVLLSLSLLVPAREFRVPSLRSLRDRTTGPRGRRRGGRDSALERPRADRDPRAHG